MAAINPTVFIGRINYTRPPEPDRKMELEIYLDWESYSFPESFCPKVFIDYPWLISTFRIIQDRRCRGGSLILKFSEWLELIFQG